MNGTFAIKSVSPTVFLAKQDGMLRQLVEITVLNNSADALCSVVVTEGAKFYERSLGLVPRGESIQKFLIDEITADTRLTFFLRANGSESPKITVEWKAPRRWIVHVVQTSHHDVGFTDLPSNVLRTHQQWLDMAVDMAEETADYPDDARFRIVVESAWSISRFMKTSERSRSEKMAELMRSGRVEVCALFGNMITEICGHEGLIRTLYHAFGLKREYGIPLLSAEHNDITGFSYGLSTVLTDAGIKLFCLGIPLYYNWSTLKLQSFWNESELFPHGGPGAFWWEAPSGKRVLLWCNNIGCNGDCRSDFPGLADRLGELERQDYPYPIIRWPVNGATRDNSPYLGDYSQSIRKWNEQWAFPHLICSTNTKFYNDFIGIVPDDLPVFKGELPGQDYPPGATSTAAATAVNRNNHIGLPAAEKLVSFANAAVGYTYQKERLLEALEDMLWYDEHVWGYHFPCGPAMKASELEKAVHAYRAAAFIDEVKNKAMARLADHIRIENNEYSLVVFNMSPDCKTGPVNAPLREIDNCGSEIVRVPPEEDERKSGYLRGVLLTDRWHVNLPPGMLDGRFRLVDSVSGESVPFQILEIEEPDETIPYAAERLGIGSGSRRYGMFEVPVGLKRDLCFIAKDIPAFGYRTYRLLPAETAPKFRNPLKTGADFIENEFYRITMDKKTGSLLEIFDKEARRQIIDTGCGYKFLSLIVRTPDSVSRPAKEFTLENAKTRVRRKGPVCCSIDITGSAFGHPLVKQTVTLYAGLRQINFSTKIIKDSTPLLDVHIAFPFAAANPKIRYEGVLSVLNPINDFLPGAYSDRLTVQNWVKLTEVDGYSILWAGLDAPVFCLSALHPGYVSPAHRCLIDESASHPPLTPDSLNNGRIFSNILSNNFGTNFSATQAGEFLFRYVITTCETCIDDRRAASFGWNAATHFEQILTKKRREGNLPESACFLSIDDERAVLVAFKKAEDARGFIMRLWNMDKEPVKTEVKLNFMKIKAAFYTNAAEEDIKALTECGAESFIVSLDKNSVVSVRIIPEVGEASVS